MGATSREPDAATGATGVNVRLRAALLRERDAATGAPRVNVCSPTAPLRERDAATGATEERRELASERRIRVAQAGHPSAAATE